MIPIHKYHHKISNEYHENLTPSTEQKCIHSIERLVEEVSRNTGIVSSHLSPLHQVAKEQDCIIGIRPVDRFATQLIVLQHS